MSLLALLQLDLPHDSFASKCSGEWADLAEKPLNPISGGILVTSRCDQGCSHRVKKVTTSAMLGQPAPCLWGDQGSNQSENSTTPTDYPMSVSEQWGDDTVHTYDGAPGGATYSERGLPELLGTAKGGNLLAICPLFWHHLPENTFAYFCMN